MQAASRALSSGFATASLALYFATVVFILLLDNGTRMGFAANFKSEITGIFLGLAEVLLLGWLYTLVLFTWNRTPFDWIYCFAKYHPDTIPALTPGGAEPEKFLGKFPFLTTKSASSRYIHDERVAGFLCSILSFFLFVCVLGYVLFVKFAPDGSSYFPATLWPLTAYAFFWGFVLLPFIPPYSSTRLSLLAVIAQIFLGAFWSVWGVPFVLNIVADMLTSLAPTLYLLETGGCFFVTGEFLVRNSTIPSELAYCGSQSFNGIWLQPAVLALPFWIRFLQCLRRMWDTREHGLTWKCLSHSVNAGKYLSCIAVVVCSGIENVYAIRGNVAQTNLWRWMWIWSLVIKTAYTYAWDIYMDWDLGQLPPRWFSKGSAEELDPLLAQQSMDLTDDTDFPPFLRPKRLFSNPALYYWAMASNLLGRVSWAFAISINFLPPVWGPLMALVEILRRAQWMIFRTENEFFQILKSKASTPEVRKRVQSLGSRD
jgi:hypothetical protein